LVPPKPVPTFVVEPTRPKAIVANKLYSQGKLPIVPCALPPSAPVTKDEQVTYARTMVKCLDRAWKPVVVASGKRFRPVASVYSYDGRKPPRTGPCADPAPDAGAFYDETESLICINWPEYADSSDLLTAQVTFWDMVAHEYGHHVQNLVGILGSYELGHRKRPTKAVVLEDSRRLELQANCLGGAFLGANRTTLDLVNQQRYRTWVYVVENAGDETRTPVVRDHGSSASQSYWTVTGFADGSPAACNTFTAAPLQVS